MVQEIEVIEVDIDGRTFWVRPVGSWVLQSNNVVAEALAVSLDKPLEWAVGFFFGNTELSIELWNIIVGIRMHDARHTHATLMLEQGVNWKIISERLGHGSVAMTLDLYAHASPGLQQAAAHGFDKVLGVVGDGAEIVEMSRV